jgi:hypothetical protein
LGVYLDIFNVANQGTPTYVIEASGANDGVESNWTDPRTPRLAARVRF